MNDEIYKIILTEVDLFGNTNIECQKELGWLLQNDCLKIKEDYGYELTENGKNLLNYYNKSNKNNC